MADLLSESVLVRVLLWFPYLWAGGLLMIAFFSFLRWRKNTKADWLKRAALGLVIWSATFVAVFGLFLVAILFEAHARFDTAVTGTPRELILRRDGNEIRIVDEEVIAELLGALRSARPVAAHNTHPINEWELTFPETGERFALGRDSQNPNEYHLKYLPSEGAPKGVFVAVGLQKMESKEITSWFHRHGF